MIDKIKEIIDKDKEDTSSYQKYIKSFCDSKKAKELFKDDEEFKLLEKSLKKEDE